MCVCVLWGDEGLCEVCVRVCVLCTLLCPKCDCCYGTLWLTQEDMAHLRREEQHGSNQAVGGVGGCVQG